MGDFFYLTETLDFVFISWHGFTLAFDALKRARVLFKVLRVWSQILALISNASIFNTLLYKSISRIA